MLQPNFKITTKETGVNSAEVIIEPLPQNFGHTMGNALRRVLLSSLEGGAATTVKITGVSHQFTTVSGMKEDVLELLLNLKEIDFAVEDETASVKLNISGAKEVTASDLELPTGVTVANPDKVLCHLTDPKAKLQATITVARGVGYEAADEHATDEIGVIPLDSSFSPVIKCNYTVEATRVGRSTNFDKVRLQLTTDGTVTPEDAVRKSTEILARYFAYVNSDEAHTAVDKTKSSIETAGFIDDLDLPTRVINALKKASINKLADLKSMSMADLKKVKNLGEKSAMQVVEKAKAKGIIIA